MKKIYKAFNIGLAGCTNWSVEAGSIDLDRWVAALCAAVWCGDWADVNEKLQVKPPKRGAHNRSMVLSLYWMIFHRLVLVALYPNASVSHVDYLSNIMRYGNNIINPSEKTNTEKRKASWYVWGHKHSQWQSKELTPKSPACFSRHGSFSFSGFSVLYLVTVMYIFQKSAFMSALEQKMITWSRQYYCYWILDRFLINSFYCVETFQYHSKKFSWMKLNKDSD